MGKSSIHGPLSMAMLNNRRVLIMIYWPSYGGFRWMVFISMLQQLIGGKHPVGFQPSVWWCRISQPANNCLKETKLEVSEVGYPQLSSIVHWDFPWNKPSYWGSSLSMETPFINQRKTIVISSYNISPLNHTQAIICVNLATFSANLVVIGVLMILNYWSLMQGWWRSVVISKDDGPLPNKKRNRVFITLIQWLAELKWFKNH